LWASVETLATCCCNLHVAKNSDKKWEALKIYSPIIFIELFSDENTTFIYSFNE